ncbi:MAG TPA: PLP-dependent aminotransferase family protein [Hyphomicrobiaceae bacterium]|nr:PLP-dependent aminotransferase family protein [Hyphomicrobiaceae bacterium]
MAGATFDFASALRPDLPAAAVRWSGFPKFNFVGGHNAPESIPIDDLREAADAVLRREGASLATYSLESGPQGYKPLREFLVQKLKADAGITCSADDILLTSGSLQGIDLVNEVLLRPGDTVLIEQATYGGVLTRFARLGVTPIGIPLDGDGMRTDALEAALSDLKAKGRLPKYIYVIPTVQNPTASIMSEGRRAEIIKLAEAYNVPIFEDECYSDLIWDRKRPPAIYAMDGSRRTIFVGSFSKSIAPALRVGFVVAPWEIMSRMLAVKKDAGSGALEQMVLAEYCTTHFDTHVDRLCKTLKGKLDALVGALEEQFGTAAEFEVPKGGIFLWVRLPAPVDTAKLAQVAAKAGVAINPGPEWSIDPDGANRCLRICYANPPIETIRNGVAALAEVCNTEFGVPTRIANTAR